MRNRIGRGQYNWWKRQGFGRRRIEYLHGPRDRLDDLGFVSGVGRKWNHSDAIFSGRMLLANDAENNQPGGEHRAKDDELAALGFKKIEKVAWFHGWTPGGLIALVVVTGGGRAGDGDNRLTCTVN